MGSVPKKVVFVHDLTVATFFLAYNPETKINAWDSFTAVDCGDVRMSYVDNEAALQALEDCKAAIYHYHRQGSPDSPTAYKDLISREVTSSNPNSLASLAKDGKPHPRIITLGGDHSVLLPILRAQASAYGSVSVIHFDRRVAKRASPALAVGLRSL